MHRLAPPGPNLLNSKKPCSAPQVTPISVGALAPSSTILSTFQGSEKKIALGLAIVASFDGSSCVH